jgi:hypothetical protein
MKYFLRPIVSFTLLFTFLFKGYSQTDSFFSADSLLAETSSSDNLHKFKPAQIIVPVALIGAGITGLESEWVKKRTVLSGTPLKLTIKLKQTTIFLMCRWWDSMPLIFAMSKATTT